MAGARGWRTSRKSAESLGPCRGDDGARERGTPADPRSRCPPSGRRSCSSGRSRGRCRRRRPSAPRPPECARTIARAAWQRRGRPRPPTRHRGPGSPSAATGASTGPHPPRTAPAARAITQLSKRGARLLLS
jgi:hypothetical protein